MSVCATTSSSWADIPCWRRSWCPSAGAVPYYGARDACFRTPHHRDVGRVVKEAQQGQSAIQDNKAYVITRAARGGPLPLSFAQERMWFLYQLSPDAAACNIPASVRGHGPLNKRPRAGRWTNWFVAMTRFGPRLHRSTDNRARSSTDSLETALGGGRCASFAG